MFTEQGGPRIEIENQDKIPVPIYSSEDQFTVEDLKAKYPDWASHYDGDAELTAMNYERTRYLREIGGRTNIGGIMRDLGGIGLEWAVDNTPREVGLEYDAHGIAGKLDAVMEVDKLL